MKDQKTRTFKTMENFVAKNRINTLQGIKDAAERCILLEFHFGRYVNVFVDRMTEQEIRDAQIYSQYNADKTKALFDINYHFQEYGGSDCRIPFCPTCVHRRR